MLTHPPPTAIFKPLGDTRGQEDILAKKDTTTEKAQELVRPLPWWGKVMIGSIGVFLIVKYTPIMEILSMFFYVVMVPVFLLASIGLISSGTVAGLSNGWRDTVEEINKRVTDKVTAAKDKAAA